MKNKKAELTSKQLITIIILITSFTIILAFFFMLNLRSTIDRESCRNSVAMRGAISFIGKSPVSLKCKTQDVCFSMGGDCVAGEKINIQSKFELKKEMTNLLVDCWWMMGEGKVDYDSPESCAICYKVYFDDEIQEGELEGEEKGFSYKALYDYMFVNKVPGEDINYLYYFYGLSSFNLVRNKISSDTNNKLDINTEKFDFNEEYVVVTSILGKKNHTPPIFVKFSASELNDKLDCSKYVTEA